MDFLAQLQWFFFRAMLESWAVHGKKIKITDMPGYKAVPFMEGDFYFLDVYCVNPNSRKSAGTTTIWYREDPVWVMNYGGLYEERAVPFLKNVLRRTYKEELFFGGRGFPYQQTKEGGCFAYFNHPRLNDFTKFGDREEIFDSETGESVGWHEYWGMCLV